MLSQEQKRFCELRLVKEHQYICWLYKVDLKVPIIHVSNSETHLGQWCPELRQISIAKRVIENYSWDCVIGIFKHEIAHQIVTDLFKEVEESPHGLHFKQACEKISCPPQYSSAVADLPEGEKNWALEELPEEYLLILKKVERLLSLAGSENEHEARLAMEKAQELQHKYNLRQMDVLTSDNYRYHLIELKKKRSTLQQGVIVSILQDFYMVNIVKSDLYYPSVNEVYKTYEIIGTQENISNAEYVYHFLENKIDQLWLCYKERNSADRREKRSFQYGLLVGFREKMQSPECEATQALVLVNDRYLGQFQNRRYPRLRSVSRSRTGVDMGVYREGISEGKKIVIHQGIKKRSGNQGHLLFAGNTNSIK